MKQHQMQSSMWPGFSVAIIIGLLLAAVVPNSHAADKIWNGAGDGTTMSSGANWVGGVAPVGGTDALVFAGTTGTNVNNDYSGVAGNAFAGITFSNNAGTFKISGNAVFLSGGITNNSTSLQYFPAIVELNSASRWFNAASGPIQCDVVNGRNNAFVLIKDGTNTLTLSSVVDNNGLIAAVTNGTLVLAKGGLSSAVHALGGSAVINIYTNGTLRIAPSTNTDQIFKNDRINMTGGTFQLQNTSEAVGSIFGGAFSSNSIVENGLVNTTNQLLMGENNNRKAIYNGTIRDGAAGVLSLAITKQSMEQFGGSLTYSGTTTVNNNGTGFSRIIINGTHIGGGAYSIFGPNSAQLAALNGSGLISATAINIYTNAYLGAGGGLSTDADAATYSDTVGILTISNAAVNLTTNTSTLDVQLNGTTAGSGYDQIAIVGSGTFSNNNGNLKITIGGGYNPAAGDKLTIVKVQGTNSANNVGVFSMLNGVATDLSQGASFVEPSSGKNFKISYRAEGSTFDAGAGNGNDIMLQVLSVPGANLTWRGDVNNLWDVSTTANWRTTNGTAVTFDPNANVIFDDSGSNSIPIDLTTSLSPTNITVNSSNNYVFATSTAGKLTGLVILTKTNTGTLGIVTDNDNSGTTIIQRGTVQIGTNGITGTLSGAVSVNANGTLAYNRSDDKVINTAAFTGTGTFVHNGSGQLTITADLSSGFTGNTTNTGGSLNFGDGSSAVGQIGGTVNVPATNVVNYNYLLNANINNSLGGNGTVNYTSANGGTLTLATTAVSSNFTGTANIAAGVRVHAQTGNQGYAFGNGSTVNVPAFSQAWCDTSGTVYNNVFNIAGTGWIGVTPPTGAISVFNATFTGAINLLADARISGTISGGTILCPISGSYQLEIWGNLGSYVLSIGSTNGVHSYASTLITSGTVRALNTNAISTGPLTMDVAADLRLNGNNLSVSNLSSISSGNVTGPGATIQNTHGSTNATLTVGLDNTSTTFDGTFTNGGGASLGLTKVGSGTLTLSGISTSTGTVAVNGGTLALSGSGTFGNAAKILANATLDVTGIGGTLTLNSGQTLGGNGNVTGAVTASAGSTVSPGNSVGTLTVSGNMALNGLVLMELNRTNSPTTNDLLVASGFTASGTLTVTNLGPALHVGDSFQLFSSSVSGFASVNLQTNDAVNNVSYTWSNTLNSDGKITVASVISPVNTSPTNIVSKVNGSNLELSWPVDHTGWTLQAQTNSLTVGLGTNWINVPGSASVNSVTNAINPANGSVFYRLVYP
jgi:autotransporter-associated beta strand protein